MNILIMDKKLSTTKDRVLKAACKIFAEKGFHEATVAEICTAARANIASVNYYFGDKETLYDHVWERAFSIATETFPINQDLPKTPTLEEMLYQFTSAILHRIFSENESGLFAKLLYREMASPTLSLKKITEDYLLPQSQYMASIIQSMPNSMLDIYARTQCVHSIIAQCAFYNFSRPLRGQMIGKETMSEKEIDHIALHIVRFSLGGLKEIQQNQSTDFAD